MKSAETRLAALEGAAVARTAIPVAIPSAPIALQQQQPQIYYPPQMYRGFAAQPTQQQPLPPSSDDPVPISYATYYQNRK